MRTQFQDTREAPNKWWAAQDARVRNAANKTHWPESVHLQVERMKAALDSLYAGRIYEAYGRRGVSIKIDNPQVRDRKWLRVLEEDWSSQGVTKTLTPQGILYKIH